MPWFQNYDPLGRPALSAVVAPIPLLVLFGTLAARRAAAWPAAAIGLATAAALAGRVFHMPAEMIGGVTAAGLVYGAVRLAWMLVAVLFVYRIAVESGEVAVLKESIAALIADQGILAVWIAVSLGTLLEGAGGGAAVAVVSAILCGLGFPPLRAAVLVLAGNCVSVAFGGMGNPIRALASSAHVTAAEATAQAGVLLAPIALLLPFAVYHLAGGPQLRAAWPQLLGTGAVFAAALLSGGHLGAQGLDLAAGGAMLVVPFLFRRSVRRSVRVTRILRAWCPFALLVGFIVVWSLAPVAKRLNTLTWQYAVPEVHLQIVTIPPIAVVRRPEPAVIEVP